MDLCGATGRTESWKPDLGRVTATAEIWARRPASDEDCRATAGDGLRRKVRLASDGSSGATAFDGSSEAVACDGEDGELEAGSGRGDGHGGDLGGDARRPLATRKSLCDG
ncbi:hypothetical protein GUJ93_ZPchr0009g261 [Zizania palustris]|uniref:DUF834 domain-containing protein n=1 Tax=Zizania palustris TaxID=103762 RepID=A0A8J5RC33_ZIZPA|nr:hypothetical protein GUJ93_ZPchr0009g261 [Zizania palustris]